MSVDASDTTQSVELLYPFYLDIDMSMAFAAALTGGVALEEEQLDRTDQTSKAVRNLRGNLKLLGALGLAGASAGVSGGREATQATATTSESRLTRHHTVASIFIDLHDELLRSGRLIEEPAIGDIEMGDIVSVRMGPATAPLRRVVDQVIRMLDLMLPMFGGEPEEEPAQTRQQRRHPPREASKPASKTEDGVNEIRQLHRLLVALRDDLEQSGLVDVVVSRDDAPSAVLTLDKRFLSAPALELLHTSGFTVVGKVTQIWHGPDEFVNLYRRSVVSLMPALTQATVWGLFALMGTIARNLDTSAFERMARSAVGVAEDETEQPSEESEAGGASNAVESQDADSDQAEENTDEVMLGDVAIAALTPAIAGPAFQILPLAICS